MGAKGPHQPGPVQSDDLDTRGLVGHASKLGHFPVRAGTRKEEVGDLRVAFCSR